jgi:hypothetical protein
MLTEVVCAAELSIVVGEYGGFGVELYVVLATKS